ncbi:MAG: hypothetical protein K6G65_06130 [Lachnospiraceae bacterium]|nr:hypothetical protein [Lachnospiraceae bacterium]
MPNVFRKFLRKEFGRNRYNQYFISYQRLITGKLDPNREDTENVFHDLYHVLGDCDRANLERRHDKLMDTLQLAVKIDKQFIFAVIFYFFAIIFLLLQGIEPLILTIALVAITGCFIYKAVEFLANKFCYIDARLILMYKDILDEMIHQLKEVEQGE